MKRTIVFYIATLTRGGAERVMVNLANYFDRQGYEVYLVTLEPDEGFYSIADGVRRIVLDQPVENGGYAGETGAGRMLGRLRAAAWRVLGVRRLIRRSRAFALVSFIGKTNLRAVLAGLGTRTKVYVSVRSAPQREYAGFAQRFLARSLFCLADGVIFQSEGARAFFPGIVRRRSRVLYNPLSPEYVREPYRGTRRDEIVTVGRMDPVKNHALLVDAFAIVAREMPRMRLTIYGDGECREAVREQSRRLGLQDRVSLPGDTRDLQDRLCGARLFVLSSDFEGMPNAVAEAFALGIPVVSTDCPSGGARALVRDGETGLLVPVGDRRKMAEAMLRILHDPALEARLGDNAYRFSRSLVPERINRMWQDFIEGRPEKKPTGRSDSGEADKL